MFVARGAADHPVRRYLWPSVDASGSLALESGEEIARDWPAAVTLNRHSSDDHAGPGTGVIDVSGLLKMRAILTNLRLVVIARRPYS